MDRPPCNYHPLRHGPARRPIESALPLDPLNGPVERDCEGCGATFTTRPELRDGAWLWVVPQHGHPLRERICPGSGTTGVEP